MADKKVEDKFWQGPEWAQDEPQAVSEKYVYVKQLHELAEKYKVTTKGGEINCTNFACGKYLFPNEPSFYLRLVELLFLCQGSSQSLALAEITPPKYTRFYLDIDLELALGDYKACPPEILSLAPGSETRLDSSCFVARVHGFVSELVGAERANANLLHASGVCKLKKAYKPSFRLVYHDLVLEKSTSRRLVLAVQNRCVASYGRSFLLQNPLQKALDLGVYDVKRPMRLPCSDKATRYTCVTCDELAKTSSGKARSLCFTGNCRSIFAGRPLLPLGKLAGGDTRVVRQGISWRRFMLGCSTRHGLEGAPFQNPPEILATLVADEPERKRGWTLPGSPVAAAPVDEWVLWDILYSPTAVARPQRVRRSGGPASSLSERSARPSSSVAGAQRSAEAEAEAELVVEWGQDIRGRLRCDERLASEAAAGSRPAHVIERLAAPYLGRWHQRCPPFDLFRARRGERAEGGALAWIRVQGARARVSTMANSTTEQVLPTYIHKSNAVSVILGSAYLHLRCLDDDCEQASKQTKILLPFWAKDEVLGLLAQTVKCE
eukprot:g47348.t1